MTNQNRGDAQMPAKGRAVGPSEETTVSQLETQEVPMDPQEANTTTAITQQEKETAPDDVKRDVDLDSMFVCFPDEFRADPRRAASLLLDLLIDPITCEAQCIALKQVSRLPESQRLRPGGLLSAPRHFLRELIWIANGQLDEAIRSGKASPELLGQLASHPGVLRLAHRALMEGIEVLTDLIRVQQDESWHWLRDEVASGRFQQKMGEEVAGKHVAIWSRSQPYSEFEVGDDPLAVRAAVAERWMVADTLIAETYVDPI